MRIVELYKVIFCSESKRYKIIFKTLENDKELILYFESQYAKNIAMASENIASVSLSQYELFINLLNELKIKIDKIIVKYRNGVLCSFIKLNNDKLEIKVNSFVGDAIIISLKTFASIYVDEQLLLDINCNDNDSKNFLLTNDSIDNIEKNIDYNSESINSKVIILQSALDKCINKENYEAAAFIRDRIQQLKNNE